uniref:Uncharacterized protein n=1 Tax=Siphoviridae sp. ctyvQ1 TaxID=2826525 RepID=A0A8S5R0L6_9CAUD|nr:MAG TPA: hypothetical protein [Siphoviridae sp. ctyvQ1]
MYAAYWSAGKYAYTVAVFNTYLNRMALWSPPTPRINIRLYKPQLVLRILYNTAVLCQYLNIYHRCLTTSSPYV